MCLIALAVDESRRFPLVVAANRDEFFSRPAARLAWWTAEPNGPQILGGRDLAASMFEALADRHVAGDEDLPDTGVGLARERELAPAFIRTPDGRYGTRCSTLVITERVNRHNLTHVLERTFTPHGGVALLRRATLNHWPPRYASTVQASAVSETEFDAGALPAAKRTRVRSLLKPEARNRRANAGA